MANNGNIALSVGVILLLVNVGVGASGVLDGVIEGSVEETVTDGYDGLDDDGNQDYTADFDDDWINSSGTKAYFANSVSNLDEVLAGTAEPTYERVGPFIYYENTTREVLEYDYEEGSITYSGYETFEWCGDCTWEGEESVSGDTVVNQINILWNTQRIAGMGRGGIEYGEIFAKAMFAAQMIEFDLSNRAPSMWASDDIAAMASAAGGGKFGNMSAEYAVLSDSYNATDHANGGDSELPNFEGMSLANSSAMKSIFYYANDGYGNCIALTCDIGPVLIAGMGAPSETVTPVRAALLGYAGDDWLDSDEIDWAVYSLAASLFVANGGGAEINSETPQLRERFAEVSGMDISVPNTLDNLLFNESVGLLTSFEIGGIPLPGMVIGLLLPLQDRDFIGAMETYSLDLLKIDALANYVEPWVGLGLTGNPTEFELILVGSTGTMVSDQWWLTAFGDYDPLGGTYIPIGLNRGGFAGMSNLSMEKSDFILNDPEFGLKTPFSGLFMYGELSGMTLPDSEGVQHTWDDAYVANLYGISEQEASALRDWVSNFYFDTVMPVLLNFVTGNTPYYSMPISSWLYGWNDAVSDFFGIFPWTSLETNATYYGSGGISTGDYSVYKMSTRGETMGQRMAQGYINSDGNGLCDYDYDSNGNFIGYDIPCEDGQIYGMTEHLTWRAPHRESGANGLLSAHAGNNDTSLMGTVGSLASPNDSFSFNVAGYAIARSEVGSETSYKGIDMVEHNINLDPTTSQIQGKLLGAGSYVDVLPGALPVYLAADIDLKVEPITTAIMYGKVKVTFHLDTRGPGNLNPDLSENSTESMPVFEIHVFNEISDEDAAAYRSQVTDNMGMFGWTNFGGEAGAPLSYVHMAIAVLYVASIASIGVGARSMMSLEEE
ncbi:MAG: CD36 family protein [Candidatus Thalassarchaeum sp.]|nr:CD36 family protein [Candidatus Thalassarchaeum sp.]